MVSDDKILEAVPDINGQSDMMVLIGRRPNVQSKLTIRTTHETAKMYS